MIAYKRYDDIASTLTTGDQMDSKIIRDGHISYFKNYSSDIVVNSMGKQIDWEMIERAARERFKITDDKNIVSMDVLVTYVETEEK